MVVSILDFAFAALCDPTRRRIIDRLSRGETSISELSEPFRMSQQAFSKHLRYLERSHLISRRKQGRQVFCALNPQVIREVAIWAEKYRAHWDPASRAEEKMK
jgi:DNA-binding transcriptional ArsR family regulator